MRFHFELRDNETGKVIIKDTDCFIGVYEDGEDMTNIANISCKEKVLAHAVVCLLGLAEGILTNLPLGLQRAIRKGSKKVAAKTHADIKKQKRVVQIPNKRIGLSNNKEEKDE